jgi:hypothetical protein
LRRVLRIIFEPKRDEVMGGWRRLHNVERMGEKRTAYRLLVGKAEGKMPIRRLKRR